MPKRVHLGGLVESQAASSPEERASRRVTAWSMGAGMAARASAVEGVAEARTMASTILRTGRPAPSGVMVNPTGSRSGDGGRVPAGAPARVCALGLVVGDDRGGPAGDQDQAASGDRVEGHGWRPRPRVMAGRRCWRWSRRAVMRVLSRDWSGSRVRSAWASVSQSRCVPSSRLWTRRVHSAPVRPGGR
jgi:hypothetical protein